MSLPTPSDGISPRRTRGAIPPPAAWRSGILSWKKLKGSQGLGAGLQPRRGTAASPPRRSGSRSTPRASPRRRAGSRESRKNWRTSWMLLEVHLEIVRRNVRLRARGRSEVLPTCRAPSHEERSPRRVTPPVSADAGRSSALDGAHLQSARMSLPENQGNESSHFREKVKAMMAAGPQKVRAIEAAGPRGCRQRARCEVQPAVAYITGQVIYVDGGITAQLSPPGQPMRPRLSPGARSPPRCPRRPGAGTCWSPRGRS